MAPKKDRDPELLKKLRERTRRGSAPGDSTHDLAQRMRNDPQGALMSMGIDDPELLKMATSALKNPEGAIRDLKSRLAQVDDEAPPPMPGTTTLREEEEEEEAPPP